jgi:hypothetical protein
MLLLPLRVAACVRDLPGGLGLLVAAVGHRGLLDAAARASRPARGRASRLAPVASTHQATPPRAALQGDAE